VPRAKRPAEPNRSSLTRWRWFVALMAGVSAVLCLVTRHHKSTTPEIELRPQTSASSTKPTPAAYAASSSCRECHADQFELWRSSHHALAQRPAAPRLDDPAFEPERTWGNGSAKTAIRKNGAAYEFLIAGLSGTQEVFHTDTVLGWSPLRQFLIPFPGGRMQALSLAYDPAHNDWFDIFGAEQRRPGEWGHWTGRGMNWNSMCAGCHNTLVQKNYDEQTDAYHSTTVEQGVGCEACHGALREHNEWQHRFGKSGRPDPTLPHFPKNRVIDNCGFCHARRSELTGDFRPGGDFLDHMRPVIVDASDSFYADGQVHEEDYEYAAFIGSRMYARGVSCLDCHNPHSGKTLLPGNFLCLRCHNGSFTNAPVIDPVAHSHHQVYAFDSGGHLTNSDLSAYLPATVKQTGGECVNCHMPQTTYMQHHHRHDHSFSIPDPLLTKRVGIPNACNRCHTDKNTEWALKYCDEWYGTRMDRPYRSQALLVASARKYEAAATNGLLAMLRTNPIPYWRAVSAGLLGPWAGESQVRAQLLKSLGDASGLVRLESIQSLEPLLSASGVAESLSHCLNDPLRAVRLAAAWALRKDLDNSPETGRELSVYLANGADQPAGQVQLAAFALARNELPAALGHYQKAIQWDPYSALSRHDYAIVLSQLNRAREAVDQLREACRLETTNSEFRLALALGLNEVGETDKAITEMREAVRLDPGYGKAWYNLGLALDSTGRTEEALQALDRSESLDANDPRIPYARATIFARLGSAEQARQAALKALQVDPGFQPARDLLQSLR
jgi:tetratricopeptide (TPR) repeat protein